VPERIGWAATISTASLYPIVPDENAILTDFKE
jgi:hypothetical protein